MGVRHCLEEGLLTMSRDVLLGVAGLGVVGGAVCTGFTKRGWTVKGYDKYKNGGMGSTADLLDCDIVFLCLPTLFSEEKGQYDHSAINEVVTSLSQSHYKGLVVLKSTVEPGTTQALSERFPNLDIAHNPEFLTARTAADDFEAQPHIVCGKTSSCDGDKFESLVSLYRSGWPDSTLSCCMSNESEACKSFGNCFYAAKVLVFNEYFLLCQKMGINFEQVVELMLLQGWVDPHHTKVPGPDGHMGFGGMCFPKDTSALLGLMTRTDSPHQVMKAVVEENKAIRGPHP